MKTDPAAEIDSQGAKFYRLEMSPQIVESSMFFFSGSCFQFMSKQMDWSNGPIWGEFGQESSSPFSQPTQVANGFPPRWGSAGKNLNTAAFEALKKPVLSVNKGFGVRCQFSETAKNKVGL